MPGSEDEAVALADAYLERSLAQKLTQGLLIRRLSRIPFVSKTVGRGFESLRPG